MINIRLPLKELRKSKGITQSDFSRIMNVAPSTIGLWEQGRREPNYSNLTRIARFFNVSTDYLLGNERQTNDENHLVDKFRRLSADGQATLLNVLNGLLASQQLKNAAQ